jgi:hypothetical protein
MPKTFPELEAGLKIDKHNLEYVCCEHPELFYEVAKQLTLLSSRRDEARQKLKEICASADAEIRHTAAVAGEKIREGDIESQIELDPTVGAARTALFDLEKKVGQVEALMEAFKSRGYMIRDLVQLHLAHYYGSEMEKSTGSLQAAGAEQMRKEQVKHFAQHQRRAPR